MTDDAPRTVASPCVGVCSIDRETRFCLGCWRSMEEIAHWSRYDDPKRLAVIETLRQRQSEAGECGQRELAYRSSYHCLVPSLCGDRMGKSRWVTFKSNFGARSA